MRGSVRGVERVIAAWQARPHDARPLVLLDFDGTLAEFDARSGDDHPDAVASDSAADARPPRRSVGGIVSGRRIADLRERIPSAPRCFWPGCTAWKSRDRGCASRTTRWRWRLRDISVLSKDLRRAVKPLPGVFVEDKTYSVVMHVRGASKADRLHAITRFNALAEPLLSEGTVRLQPGDQVFELLPNVDWAKGDAVRAIIRQVETDTKETVWPVYIGDDATDEDAFEEIGTNGLTIAVGKRPPARRFRSTIRPRWSVS